MKKRWKDWTRSSFRFLKLACLGLSLFWLTSQNAMAKLDVVESTSSSTIQQIQLIKGKVADSKGEPLPGVNIVIKGTTTGVISNLDGEYSLEAPIGSTIVYSFIGFQTKEIIVGANSEINITLEDDSMGLDEVVVTAMGVSSEKKKLNFAVQGVKSEVITRDKQANFVQALDGRIAGVSLTGQGGSPNAASQMYIRGVSSFNTGQNNEPIFILNGMYVSGGATKAAEINPLDIESVTVLKGAAAAALYGSDAANGAIVINTKSGKEGKLSVQWNSSLQVEEAYRTPEIQDTYLRGGLGVYREQSKGGWGPLKPEGMPAFDNVDNFLQTGLFHKHDVSLSGGSKKFTSYSSVSYTDHEGIVPNDYLERLGIMSKTDYNVRDNLTVSLLVNLSNKKSRGAGKMTSVYTWPIDDDISNYKNPDGSIRWLYENTNSKYSSPLNPLWGRNEDKAESKSNRTLTQGSINWEPITNLTLTGRVGYDVTNSESLSVITERWALEAGEKPTAEALPFLGQMWYKDYRTELMNYNALATYSYDISKKLKLDALVGVDFLRKRTRENHQGGYHFVLPGFHSINNLGAKDKGNQEMYRTEYDKYGVFGEMKLDYDGIAHISFTGRNDKSSSLAVGKNSYFYPSVTGGVVFTELFDINSPLISFGKLRGNWAQVGKDTTPYKNYRVFKMMSHPDWGFGVDPTVASNPYLTNELTTSWEIGADFRLFNDKTRLDVAYYNTNVADQIVTVRVSPATGNVLMIRNEGEIINKGIEVVLDQVILQRSDLKWNMAINFASNKGRLGDMPDGIKEVYHHAGQVGDIRPSSYVNGPVFAISGKDYLRTESGAVIVDEEGYPLIDPSPSLLLGNRESDFSLGIDNRVNYKNWSFSALINMQVGADVVNGTRRTLMSNGMDGRMSDYRNREIVVDGVVEQADGNYVANTKPVVYDQLFVNNYYTNVGSNFIEEASFVRLQNVTVGYDLTRLVNRYGIGNLKLSLTGRNLLLLTDYSGIDPSVNLTGNAGGAGTLGIDYNGVPATRSILFNISATF
ncbi:SusC/RagA family TonB-linked outer membrane protein [Carboxylicivirga taeanensis]|uniref:SusC/RagA family TonB-linked outer membrane protein n=1 Tax=Carboxylicivirga taeanensis TaxID=1416875 RepID=UPI003F6DEEB3